MSFEPASEVLSNITVLDLTRVRAGPTCVRQLADWGANVIKIEMPATDDKGQLGGPRAGSDFQNLHRNKRAMTLNLKSAEGVEVFTLSEQAEPAFWLAYLAYPRLIEYVPFSHAEYRMKRLPGATCRMHLSPESLQTSPKNRRLRLARMTCPSS